MKKIEIQLKRALDLIGSSFGLIVISPIFILIIFLIKITSTGPIFFVQKRLGIRGEEFNILKFRTMVVDAEKLGDGLFVKNGDDQRITRIGKILRATSLDELPQLINVLKGDMSLVGPRPPVPHHPYLFEDYSDLQRKRFLMKPGITGLAQVTVRNSVPWETRIQFDIKYIQEFSLWLDIKILTLTVKKIFAKESIYTHS